jgi:iron complex outermembrane recepter protein
VRLLASYGEGFRSPQARGLAEGETTPFTSVTSFELGARLTGRWVAATLAAFQTRLSDDLVFDQRTTRNERVPATKRTGVAADVTSSPVRWFIAAASATFTEAVFTASNADYASGDLVPYAPQWVLRLDTAVTPHLGSLHGLPVEGRLGAGASVLARRPLPYGQWGHDIFLLDAVASVRVAGVALAIEAFNLLDAHWYDGEFVFASRWDPGAAASLVPQRHVTVGAPRTLLLSLSLFI